MLANISINNSDQHVGPVCFDSQQEVTNMSNCSFIPCWPTCWYAPQIAQTCHFSLFLQICWPTFLNFLRNVGQHLSLIFSFPNVFVHKANRTNILANMLVSRCWSKCWPTCCPVCAGLNLISNGRKTVQQVSRDKKSCQYKEQSLLQRLQ